LPIGFAFSLNDLGFLPSFFFTYFSNFPKFIRGWENAGEETKEKINVAGMSQLKSRIKEI
jgi:hypothetical protein